MFAKHQPQRFVSQPKELSEVMPGALDALGLVEGIARGKVLNEWGVIVGEHIAKETTADYFEKDVLIVRVTSSAWRNELLFYKQDILKKIRSVVGEGIVSDIRFR